MDIYLGILAFTFIVALLVAFVMFARSQLVSTGDVTIEINGDQKKHNGANRRQTAEHISREKYLFSFSLWRVVPAQNVSAKYPMVEDQFFQLSNHILTTNNKRIIGDFHAKFQ